jgi:hypothetical protein
MDEGLYADFALLVTLFIPTMKNILSYPSHLAEQRKDTHLSQDAHPNPFDQLRVRHIFCSHHNPQFSCKPYTRKFPTFCSRILHRDNTPER